MRDINFIVIIPARYSSSRLPGKPLLDIVGQVLVERVYRQACLSGASKVLVATDDQRIVETVTRFGGEVLLTSADHVSGTDRLAEVVEQLGLADDDIVVNVQGDEPLIPPAVIDQVATNLATNVSAGVATLSEQIASLAMLLDPNVVKVVTDQAGLALYFSRAAIPWPRDYFAQSQDTLPGDLPDALPEAHAYQRHIGLYAYRAGLLRKFVDWPVAGIEQTEMLEQLRFMAQGVKIHVEYAVEPVPPGVDTEDDLQAVIEQIEAGLSVQPPRGGKT